MSDAEHVARQRRFYEEGEHAHLLPHAEDAYAAKLARRVCERLGIGPGHRVLELGAGFGRFTFHLLDHCGSVLALDLSPRLLESLAAVRDERDIPEARCRVLCADLAELDDGTPGERFDFAVGFFLLHHLADPGEGIRRAAARVRPGGGVAFLEPNRLNPLFAAQISLCADMHWREERGMYRLSGRSLAASFTDAGLGDVEAGNFGFFPPPLLNRFGPLRGLERRLERVPLLGWVLPMVLVSGRTPEAQGAAR